MESMGWAAEEQRMVGRPVAPISKVGLGAGGRVQKGKDACQGTE